MSSQSSSYDPNFNPGPELCLVNQLDNDDEMFDSLPDDERRAIRCKYGNCPLRAFMSEPDTCVMINDCEFMTDTIDPPTLDNRGEF